jgi:hypothetical protein
MQKTNTKKRKRGGSIQKAAITGAVIGSMMKRPKNKLSLNDYEKRDQSLKRVRHAGVEEFDKNVQAMKKYASNKLENVVETGSKVAGPAAGHAAAELHHNAHAFNWFTKSNKSNNKK